VSSPARSVTRYSSSEITLLAFLFCVFLSCPLDCAPAEQAWLHKNLKLWSFYCDLEESLGTLASSREVYDRMIELKIATPQIFLNYAHLLWEVCQTLPLPVLFPKQLGLGFNITWL
jgi:hypothetical protein